MRKSTITGARLPLRLGEPSRASALRRGLSRTAAPARLRPRRAVR
jgi:hypothetical protein